MIDVLVAFASRHGSTEELAHAIGRELTRGGLSVDVRPMAEVDSLDGYSACVLGSAVYMGTWMAEARDFLERHRETLGARPTWLFSSGPVGHLRSGTGDAFDASGLVEAAHARDHHLFGGKLDRRALGMGERLVARIARVGEGDHRDWAIAAAWAMAISRALDAERAVSR